MRIRAHEKTNISRKMREEYKLQKKKIMAIDW